MSGTTQMAEIKSVVLVHGAFADGSCYAKVIPLLSTGHSGAESLELAC
jgi:hypothetical protein